MTLTQNPKGASRPPVPLLFLISDTGGGHRSAAAAVVQALEHAWPGRFAPVSYDPLRGPEAPRWMRWTFGLYGPCIRLTPWLWGVIWRISNSARVPAWLRRRIMAPGYDIVAAAVAVRRPAVVVSFHPITVGLAVRVRDRAAPSPPALVFTVVTDLVTAHRAWRHPAVDRLIVPSDPIAAQCASDGIADGRCVQLGLPVAAEFCQPPLAAPARRRLRRDFGASGRFLVLVTGGAEGSGGIYRRTAAILRHVPDVDVAVICGRNRRLRRRLTRLAARTAKRGGETRLTVHGFVDNMADWMRCADIVVGKAGPGTIAEAMCCGTPLILTSRVPGQEDGNAAFVVAAGAGRYAPRPRQLAAEVARLRRDRTARLVMRAAAARAGRPRAAADIAYLIAAAASDTIVGDGQVALTTTSRIG